MRKGNAPQTPPETGFWTIRTLPLSFHHTHQFNPLIIIEKLQLASSAAKPYPALMTDFIEAAIKEAGLTLETAPADKPDSYRCTISNGRYEMIRTMRMKPDYPPPSLGGLLLYYAGQVQQIYDCDDILDWAEDYELDLNDSKIRDKFTNLVKDQDALRMLLGDDGFHKMMGGLEIHQAISNARPR